MKNSQIKFIAFPSQEITTSVKELDDRFMRYQLARSLAIAAREIMTDVKNEIENAVDLDADKHFMNKNDRAKHRRALQSIRKQITELKMIDSDDIEMPFAVFVPISARMKPRK